MMAFPGGDGYSTEYTESRKSWKSNDLNSPKKLDGESHE